ncbi:MAG: 50S ribosomal protein L6 [Syntrophobacteraceae bacterium CG2_30_61_12]|nr:MAG: 50S ribosomal protein L6 [Syntrophobacteraceae bacterium CG2_30_61_12]PIU32881.1 MAG: 50S ribosomal protein L6 [Syntrophobacteraceae bacterium CG07_land_8_20_14_0_80_61_8]
MSRVGKNPVPVPKGVNVTFDGALLTVNGPKGSLSRQLPAAIEVELSGEAIVLKRHDDNRQSRSLHGLTRALVSNMVVGVSTGFVRLLEIHGIGYRADAKNKILNLNVGHSHPVMFTLPEGISASVDKQNVIRLEGIDRELLGQTAAKIRAVRSCEPYKGKGIRYGGENIRRKAGKTGAKK